MPLPASPAPESGCGRVSREEAQRTHYAHQRRAADAQLGRELGVGNECPLSVALFVKGAGNPFNSRPTQCGSLAITGTGTSAPGATLRFTLTGGGVMGTMLGVPGNISLAPICNCTLGVQNAVHLPNPLVLPIPITPGILGVTLAVQGYGTGGTACLSTLTFSHTIDFTIL